MDMQRQSNDKTEMSSILEILEKNIKLNKMNEIKGYVKFHQISQTVKEIPQLVCRVEWTLGFKQVNSALGGGTTKIINTLKMLCKDSTATM